MKFIRFDITVWLVEEREDNKLAGVTKMESVDLEGDKFNEFVNWKLNIIKKLINEI